MCYRGQEYLGIKVLFRSTDSSKRGPKSSDLEVGNVDRDLYSFKTIDFVPNSLCPEFLGNELLYMILLDNVTMEQFVKNNTFATVVTYAHDKLKITSNGGTNVTQSQPRNGSYLENVVQGASVLATHRSIAGVSFCVFM